MRSAPGGNSDIPKSDEFGTTSPGLAYDNAPNHTPANDPSSTSMGLNALPLGKNLGTMNVARRGLEESLTPTPSPLAVVVAQPCCDECLNYENYDICCFGQTIEWCNSNRPGWNDGLCDLPGDGTCPALPGGGH